MSIQHFLQHRRFYEVVAISSLLLLIVVINVTTLGIEYMRDGTGQDWREAWATESTSVLILAILLVPLMWFLGRLNLTFMNFRWRALWLIPAFLLFSFLHVGGFVALRKILWSLAGGEYSFEPWLLGMVYELRKDFLDFLIICIVFYAYRFIIVRLQGEARFLDSDSQNKEENQRSQFLVKMLDREYLVKVNDIDWVQSASNYVVLHCGKRSYPMRETMKNLSEELTADQFLRVHRTAIVNLDKVQSLKDKGDSSLSLHSGATVPVSKTYLPDLRAALESGSGSEIHSI